MKLLLFRGTKLKSMRICTSLRNQLRSWTGKSNARNKVAYQLWRFGGALNAVPNSLGSEKIKWSKSIHICFPVLSTLCLKEFRDEIPFNRGMMWQLLILVNESQTGQRKSTVVNASQRRSTMVKGTSNDLFMFKIVDLSLSWLKTMCFYANPNYAREA